MMSAKNIARLAKKWQRMAAMGKSLTSSTSGEETGGPCGTSCSPVAGKGHFIVYTADGVRFEVSLAFLGTTVFGELLRMSQEEFGFTGVDGGRMKLPRIDDGVCHVPAQEKCHRRDGGHVPQHHGDAMPLSCGATSGNSQHFGVCSS